MVMHKRWNIISADPQKVTRLKKELAVNEMVCRILVQRDVESYEQARNFFRPALSQLHSPWLMKDMNKAVERVLAAIAKREKILVYGDYDVDGTTSVAILFNFLRTVYNPSLIDFYVPHRFREGYGVSKAGIDHALANDFKLIICLDCGIKSVELISYAQLSGLDCIICDHHLPDAILPPAIAILNPKQQNCTYPYKELCGCGVTFKLVTAIAEKIGFSHDFTSGYLDLVATAIAADIVPMTGENRIMVFHGLEKINSNPSAGIKALMALSGLQGRLSITNVVFVIAPRVNAAGRMDDASKAVKLFTETNYENAYRFAEMLHADNADRKETDLSITEEALAMLEGNEIMLTRKSTVLFQPHWHKGVVGIVASRLIEKYYRPTIILTQSGDLVAGSARSISGFNLYEAIHACRDHLVGYGGHFAAAGISMHSHQVDAFCKKFEEVVSETIQPQMLVPEILIDLELSFKELTPGFYRIISQMAPFGPGNMKPVFISKRVIDDGWARVLKNQHVKCCLVQENIKIGAIGFNLGGRLSDLQTRKPIDVVYHLEENEWNNEKQLQLKIIDFRFSES